MRKYLTRTTYYAVLGTIAVVLILGLMYLRFREDDIYYASSEESGQVSEKEYADTVPGANASAMDRDGEKYVIVAEGFEQVYVYPGTYEISVCAKLADVQAFYQIVDVGTNTVLVEHEYIPGEEYHVARFTIEESCEYVVVRSYVLSTSSGESDAEGMASYASDPESSLTIYGYTMTSDGYVCNDAKWQVMLAFVVLLLLGAGVYRWVMCGRRAMLTLSVLWMLTALPFAGDGLLNVYDLSFHMARIYSLGATIADGTLPQRLMVHMSGAALTPVMYPELCLYGAGWMVALGASVYLAYKVTCAVILCLTVFLAYGAARLVSGERTALFFSAVYTLNPFLLNNLFQCGMIGQGFAMSFLPLAGVGMWLTMCGDRRPERLQGGICLIIAYTGMLSSHILTSVLAAVFCALFVAVLLLAHPVKFVRKASRLLYILAAAVVTVLLNLWYLVPFLGYYGWDFYLSQYSIETVQSNAVSFWNLFAQEVYVYNEQVYRDNRYVTMGPAALLAVILFFGMLLMEAEQKRRTGELSGEIRAAEETDRWPEKSRRYLGDTERRAGIFSALLFGLAIFMCTEAFPWVWLSQHSLLFSALIGKVQFPWRLLIIAVPLGSLLIVIAVRALFRRSEKISNLLATALVLVCLWTGIQTISDYLIMDVSYGKFENTLSLNWDYVLNSADYTTSTAWIASGNGPEITSAEEMDEVEITDFHADGTDYVFSFVNSSGEDIVVTVPVYWYGLHTATLEEAVSGEAQADAVMNSPGTGIETEDTAEDSGEGDVILSSSMNEELQFTDIVIPGNVTSGTVSLVYEEPQSWRYAEWVSLGAAVVSAAALLAYLFRRRRG